MTMFTPLRPGDNWTWSIHLTLAKFGNPTTTLSWRFSRWRERGGGGGKIMPSLMATSLRSCTHSARTKMCGGMYNTLFCGHNSFNKNNLKIRKVLQLPLTGVLMPRTPTHSMYFWKIIPLNNVFKLVTTQNVKNFERKDLLIFLFV